MSAVAWGFTGKRVVTRPFPQVETAFMVFADGETALLEQSFPKVSGHSPTPTRL
jgi:hypothetical protein